jgi:hypothetical protein
VLLQDKLVDVTDAVGAIMVRLGDDMLSELVVLDSKIGLLLAPEASV